MPFKEQIQELNKVSEAETAKALQVIANSIVVEPDSTNEDLRHISAVVSLLSDAFSKAMQENIVKSREDRLQVVLFLDKLQQHKESIDMVGSDRQKLRIAAQRLGKKMQSSTGARKKSGAQSSTRKSSH